ncbi:kynurenine/alpha-aminoadipate aminotransferase, mitochondrial isoform X2 [Strongylocentrotus purpuratus]|uniref:Aminotransferase class I/classII large domain-containing protein n=1 Tax=Strongylocentrotus purpuratus TaxID=7668 RepID=A0A7M7P0E1_STRPU|nr:kynurenine/alpha-aminoadipate aminotransferase, mitochondrial isoform X2 [Strongylocentrotus purpuratus]
MSRRSSTAFTDCSFVHSRHQTATKQDLTPSTLTMDYDKFLTRRAVLSQPSPIRLFHKMALESSEPVINMVPGSPNDDRTYLVGAKFNLRDGATMELDESDMRVAQQYNLSDGIIPFREWLTELTVKLHHPPTYGDENKEKALRVIVNCGGIQGISGLRRSEAVTISLKSEEDGLNIEQLEEILSQYDPTDQQKWCERPKVLYTVPNGNNPTGKTTSLEKRRKIYALAQKYDFIIIEDDSYYFTQFNEPRIPSYLSLDVDGRVIRCDSFSKVIGAGFRLGWLSGPCALVTRIFYELQYTVQHASIFAQVVVNKLVRQWGIEGFLRRADDLRDFYQRRRDTAVQAATTHLTGLATWVVPQCGLFLWMKLTGLEGDSTSFIRSFAIKNQFMMTPGGLFTLEKRGPCPYLRASFSHVSEPELEEGMKRLATSLKEASAQQNENA